MILYWIRFGGGNFRESMIPPSPYLLCTFTLLIVSWKWDHWTNLKRILIPSLRFSEIQRISEELTKKKKKLKKKERKKDLWAILKKPKVNKMTENMPWSMQFRCRHFLRSRLQLFIIIVRWVQRRIVKSEVQLKEHFRLVIMRDMTIQIIWNHHLADQNKGQDHRFQINYKMNSLLDQKEILTCSSLLFHKLVRENRILIQS